VIYAEGGGNTAGQKAELRRGFDGLLEKWKLQAGAKRLSLRVVCAGGRDQAYGAFINALRINPDVVNVLLVDSETLVATCNGNATQDSRVRVAHLTHRDNWDFAEAQAARVHLMAQCMEAWFVADASALAEFYGQRFVRNALPTRLNLEEEPKKDVYDKLARATRATQKGEYGKIKHASQLLQKIDPARVAQRCPRFARLTSWLEQTIAAAQ
jgi:Domain of unknown function (DUF4276)